MRRFKRKNLTSARAGYSDKLMYQNLVGFERREETDAVIKLKDDALLTGFWMEGVDMEAASGPQLRYLRAAWNQSGRVLDEGWMLHIEDLGRLDKAYITGNFAEPVEATIDEERRERAVYYRSYAAIYVTWKPSLLERTSWGQVIHEVLSGGAAGRVRTLLEKQLEKFEATLSEYQERLQRCGLRLQRMRCSTRNCELLQSLNFVINREWHPCRPPRHGCYLDTLLSRDLFNDRAPGELRSGGKEVVVIGVQGYPSGDDGEGTEMGMLAELQQLGIEYRWSNRFIILDYHEAHSFFGKLRKIWRKYRTPMLAQVTGDREAPVNDDAVARVEEVRRAMNDLERRVWAYGHHTCSVVLMGPDREKLLESAKLVITKFQEAGFPADIERLNGFEALRGTYPGHGRENVRKPAINMVQFGDLAPLMLEWRGDPYSSCPALPPKSPPIMLARTVSGASFRFHLHIRDLGHALVLGPTRAGKSAFLAFLKAQWGRYPGSQVIAFDKGYSMQPLALACADAVHYALGETDGPMLAPLSALDSRADVDWAKSWVRSLFGNLATQLTDAQCALLDHAVDTLAASTSSAEQRSLTKLLGLVQDVALREALRFYTAGSGARVLNGKSDALRYARFTVFELEELFAMEAAVVAPTLLYLFRQISRRLTGAPTLLIIDEAWLVLDSPQFSAQLREWLKVLAKANCSVVLATQSLTDIVDSPIKSAVFGSCPTRILLPNHEAASSSMHGLYADHLQLTDEQIELVANAQPKRDYYYVAKHPDGARSRMFQLDLGPAALSFVGAASKDADLPRVRALHAEHGRMWPAYWLAERGLEGWAERFAQLEQARQASQSFRAA